MKLVYCHNREIQYPYTEPFTNGKTPLSPKGGSTVAMEAIQSWVLDTLEQGSSIIRKVGIARCSDEDNYDKKVGRQLAESRLKNTTLTVINLYKNADLLVVFFEDDQGNLFEVKKSGDPYCARLIRMLDD